MNDKSHFDGGASFNYSNSKHNNDNHSSNDSKVPTSGPGKGVLISSYRPLNTLANANGRPKHLNNSNTIGINLNTLSNAHERPNQATNRSPNRSHASSVCSSIGYSSATLNSTPCPSERIMNRKANHTDSNIRANSSDELWSQNARRSESYPRFGSSVLISAGSHDGNKNIQKEEDIHKNLHSANDKKLDSVTKITAKNKDDSMARTGARSSSESCISSLHPTNSDLAESNLINRHHKYDPFISNSQSRASPKGDSPGRNIGLNSSQESNTNMAMMVMQEFGTNNLDTPIQKEKFNGSVILWDDTMVEKSELNFGETNKIRENNSSNSKKRANKDIFENELEELLPKRSKPIDFPKKMEQEKPNHPSLLRKGNPQFDSTFETKSPIRKDTEMKLVKSSPSVYNRIESPLNQRVDLQSNTINSNIHHTEGYSNNTNFNNHNNIINTDQHLQDSPLKRRLAYKSLTSAVIPATKTSKFSDLDQMQMSKSVGHSGDLMQMAISFSKSGSLKRPASCVKDDFQKPDDQYPVGAFNIPDTKIDEKNTLEPDEGNDKVSAVSKDYFITKNTTVESEMFQIQQSFEPVQPTKYDQNKAQQSCRKLVTSTPKSQSTPAKLTSNNIEIIHSPQIPLPNPQPLQSSRSLLPAKPSQTLQNHPRLPRSANRLSRIFPSDSSTSSSPMMTNLNKSNDYTKESTIDKGLDTIFDDDLDLDDFDDDLNFDDFDDIFKDNNNGLQGPKKVNPTALDTDLKLVGTEITRDDTHFSKRDKLDNDSVSLPFVSPSSENINKQRDTILASSKPRIGGTNFVPKKNVLVGQSVEEAGDKNDIPPNSNKTSVVEPSHDTQSSLNVTKLSKLSVGKNTETEDSSFSTKNDTKLKEDSESTLNIPNIQTSHENLNHDENSDFDFDSDDLDDPEFDAEFCNDNRESTPQLLPDESFILGNAMGKRKAFQRAQTVQELHISRTDGSIINTVPKSTTVAGDIHVPSMASKSFKKDTITSSIQMSMRLISESLPPVKSLIKNPYMRRFAVKSVENGVYSFKDRNNRLYERNECVLTAVGEDATLFEICLRDRWLNCIPDVDHIVHVIFKNPDGTSPLEKRVEKQNKNLDINSLHTLTENETSQSNFNSVSHPQIQHSDNRKCTIVERIVVDNDHNLFITCPDTLTTVTSVAGSFDCLRKPILRERVFLPNGPGTEAMILGTLVHLFFQKCLKVRNFEDKFMNDTANSLIDTYMEDIILAGSSRGHFVYEMESAKLQIKNWAELYFAQVPKPKSFIIADAGAPPALFALKDVVDIEERIYSPVYGLKGDMDITAQVVLNNATSSKQSLAPMEIKTSKKYQDASHAAQTMLYTLMVAERYGLYDAGVSFGILVYIMQQQTLQVMASLKDLGEIIVQRNKLAMAIKNNGPELPPIEAKDFTCRHCDYSFVCMMSNNIVEGGSSTDYPESLREEYNELASLLSDPAKEFYEKWDDLLRKEETLVAGYQRDVWTMESKEREVKQGLCFASLKIDSVEKTSYGFVSSLSRCDYNVEFDISGSSISQGDYIYITDEKTNHIVSRGIFKGGTKQMLRILSDRDLNIVLSYNVPNDTSHSSSSDSQSPGTCKLRIDKEIYETFFGLARYNIIALLRQEPAQDKLKRLLLLDNYKPTFNSPLPKYEITNYELNEDQLNAIDKVIKADDCALILGMPGTGKTTSTAALIDTLVKLGKSVLLSSYTHSAVDNILLKIKDNGYKILRLGSLRNIHVDVHSLALSDDRVVETQEDLDNIYMKPQVVAATCMGTRHWLFSQRRFDYCIVDEASQVTLPTCLGPILLADKFVLVGDHYQLSPVVRNPEALEGGLAVSLFKYLNDKFPETVVNLEHQYRMCKDIMLLSNSLIYNGKLKCGTEEIANLSLKIENQQAIDSWKTTSCAKNRETDWLSWVLKEENKVLFLDTDNIPEATEIVKDDRIQNFGEAKLVYTIVEALCACGVEESSIGVLTVYRTQLRLLKAVLSERRGIEKLTADRFQGRDKECVVISLVRSNSSNQIGELLQDWRRINVAFTRAKSKLIIIGSYSTLNSVDGLKYFFDIMNSHRWIYQLPFDATEIYKLPAQTVTEDFLHDEFNNISMFRYIASSPQRSLVSDVPMVGGNSFSVTGSGVQEMLGLKIKPKPDSKCMNDFVSPLVKASSSRSSAVQKPVATSANKRSLLVTPKKSSAAAFRDDKSNRDGGKQSAGKARAAARFFPGQEVQYKSLGPVAQEALAEHGVTPNTLKESSNGLRKFAKDEGARGSNKGSGRNHKVNDW